MSAAAQGQLHHLQASSLHLAAAAPTTSAFIGAEAVRLARLLPDSSVASSLRKTGRVENCNGCGLPLLPGWNARRRVVRGVVSGGGRGGVGVGVGVGVGAGQEGKVPRKSKRRRVEWDVRKEKKPSDAPGHDDGSIGTIRPIVERNQDTAGDAIDNNTAQRSAMDANRDEKASIISKSKSKGSRAIQGDTAIVRTPMELHTTCLHCRRLTRTPVAPAPARSQGFPPPRPQRIVTDAGAALDTATSSKLSEQVGATKAQVEKAKTETASAAAKTRARAKARKKGGLGAKVSGTGGGAPGDAGKSLGLGLMDFMKGV